MYRVPEHQGYTETPLLDADQAPFYALHLSSARLAKGLPGFRLRGRTVRNPMEPCVSDSRHNVGLGHGHDSPQLGKAGSPHLPLEVLHLSVSLIHLHPIQVLGQEHIV